MSRSDLVAVLEAIDLSLRAATEDEFRTLVGRVAQVVPFRSAQACVVRTGDAGQVVAPVRSVSVGFPPGWIKVYAERRYGAVDPIAACVLDSAEPLIWSNIRRQYAEDVHRKFYAAAAEFGLCEGFSFGLRFQQAALASIVACEGVDIAGHRRHIAAITCLMPHLHVALAKMQLGVLKSRVNLTTREAEVLNWAKFGKSNWEISVQLAVSSRAVKFHIENAMRKLGAINRTQAIAIALSQGAIEWG